MSLTLPLNPSLEHLKHQAKALLRAYQAHDPTALQRFAAAHPHFAGTSANRKRTSPCRLADALLVIAREYGFPCWAKLKAHVEAAGKQPEASAREVYGTVVTPEGAPVAGATVSWIEQTPGGSQQCQTTRTDAEGQFRFQEVRPELGTPFSVTFMVQAPEWGLSFQTRRASPMTIRLQPATDLPVAFLGPEGKPVPTLRVRVHRLYERSLGALDIPADLPGPWRQQTNTQGMCVFPGLPQGVQVQFAVEDEAFAAPELKDCINLALVATQPPAAIALLFGGAIQGRVTLRGKGQPVAGIYVGAHAAERAIGGGKAVTDADGNYRITQLRPGFYNLSLRLEFSREAWEHQVTARALEIVEVKPGVTRERQNFTLIQGSLLTGKVIDAHTGEPLAGINIGISGPAHPQASGAVQSVITGPDGVYRARVPAGRQHVYVMGLGPLYTRYAPPKEGVHIVVGENTTVQDFTLVPFSDSDLKPIHGRVLGPDSRPVAKAVVIIKPTEWPSPLFRHPVASIETDEHGTFGLEPARGALRLGARSGALATDKILLAHGGEEITLHLKPNVLLPLSGRVINVEGEPIPGAKVSLQDWWQKLGAPIATTTTDSQGRFTFLDLLADARYSVWVEAVGYSTQGSECRDARPGEPIELPTLTLPRADRSLAGRVVDTRGKPVGKQGVRLQGKYSRAQDSFTDKKGYFRFEGIVNEEVTLYLHNGGGFSPNRTQAHAGDTEVVLIKA
ncbi:MAG TPA: carboxypeptidase regulatory-like domain-containing protein [Chthonomonadaceae bacterium]|nr:carboxypeptidase regulatory-like domain-containing protein [Chthonomonadaceae bacterium]